MQLPIVNFTVFSSRLREGTSKATGRPYSFYQVQIQIDQAGNPAFVGSINYNENLEPGDYQAEILFGLRQQGQFTNISHAFRNIKKVK